MPPSSRTRPPSSSTRAAGRRAELRAVWHYRLRGYRVLARNVWAGGYEVDIVLRRGSRLVFCEVKSKSGDRAGDPLEMVDPGKTRRLRRAAEAWLAARPELAGLDTSFEVVAVRPQGLQRVPLAPP